MALLYTLDDNGLQTSCNISSLRPGKGDASGLGKKRSERPCYLLAKSSDSVVVTEPYFSNNGSMLCISAAVKSHADKGESGYIVLDIDLTKAIEFLMGDPARRRFMPAFKGIYSLIVAGLFAVAGVLLYAAGAEMISLWHIGANREDLHMKPFGVIIFPTLALAIFDLGKTILEEEVLMHKDIFRHSSTRRAITRFVGDIVSAVWMMLTAVGLLVGLGIHVYLGAKAEAILKGSRR